MKSTKKTLNVIHIPSSFHAEIIWYGHTILIDREDVPLVIDLNVYLSDDTYPCVKIGNKKIKLHRLIMNAKSSEEIDHINLNRLDARKSNLRVATKSMNGLNRGLQSNNSTGMKGVQRKVGGKYGVHYQALIYIEAKKYFLGSFATKNEAAHAYNVAIIKYHGYKFVFNITENDYLNYTPIPTTLAGKFVLSRLPIKSDFYEQL